MDIFEENDFKNILLIVNFYPDAYDSEEEIYHHPFKFCNIDKIDKEDKIVYVSYVNDSNEIKYDKITRRNIIGWIEKDEYLNNK